MRKNLVKLYALACAFTMMIASANAQTTHLVDSTGVTPGSVTTIGAAVVAAADGDTIDLAAGGPYVEEVLMLAGAGTGKDNITFTNTGSCVWTPPAAGAFGAGVALVVGDGPNAMTLDGIEISGGGAGSSGIFWATNATLNLNNCNIDNNGGWGVGIAGGLSAAGGRDFAGGFATISVSNTSVSGNGISGIYFDEGRASGDSGYVIMNIVDSTIDNNLGANPSAGIHIFSQTGASEINLSGTTSVSGNAGRGVNIGESPAQTNIDGTPSITATGTVSINGNGNFGVAIVGTPGTATTGTIDLTGATLDGNVGGVGAILVGQSNVVALDGCAISNTVAQAVLMNQPNASLTATNCNLTANGEGFVNIGAGADTTITGGTITGTGHNSVANGTGPLSVSGTQITQDSIGNPASVGIEFSGATTIALAAGSYFNAGRPLVLHGSGTVDMNGADLTASGPDTVLYDAATGSLVLDMNGGSIISNAATNSRALRSITTGGTLTVNMGGGNISSAADNFACVWQQNASTMSLNMEGGTITGPAAQPAVLVGNGLGFILDITLGGGAIHCGTGAAGISNAGSLTITGPGSADGGIWTCFNDQAGNMTLNDLSIDGNGPGSAIYQQITSTGDLTVNGCTITVSAGGGQGIEISNVGDPGWACPGTVTVTDTLITGSPGAGIFGYSSGNWDISGSTITLNNTVGVLAAANGANIVTPNITMTDCWVTGNLGGVGLQPAVGADGIPVDVTMTNCVVSGNAAPAAVGSSEGGTFVLNDCLLDANGAYGFFTGGPATNITMNGTTISNHAAINFWSWDNAATSDAHVVSLTDCTFAGGSYGTLFDVPNSTVSVDGCEYTVGAQNARVQGANSTAAFSNCTFNGSNIDTIAGITLDMVDCDWINASGTILRGGVYTVTGGNFVNSDAVTFASATVSTATLEGCTVDNTPLINFYNVNGGATGILNVSNTDHITSNSRMMSLTTGTMIAEFEHCTFQKRDGALNPNWFLLDYATSETTIVFDQCDFVNGGGDPLAGQGLSALWARAASVAESRPNSFPGTVTVIDSILKDAAIYCDVVDGGTQSYNLLDGNSGFPLSGNAEVGAAWLDGAGTIAGSANYVSTAFGDLGYLEIGEGSAAGSLNSGNGPEHYAGAKGGVGVVNAASHWAIFN